MPKHVFFDLDKTLTRARSPMADVHEELFEHLCRTVDVVVVTGGEEAQIRTQIPLEPKGHYYMLSQQGNYAVGKDGTLLWHESISPEQEAAVRAFVEVLKDDLKISVKDENDLFENRGSQLAYSVLGFHERVEKKYAYDPGDSKRQALLTRHADELKELKKIGIEAMPAGTTTIDFILAGKHKGSNIARLIEHEGWNKDECIYIGDALFKGGNDESVIGVIATHPIKDPDETFDFIETNLLSS